MDEPPENETEGSTLWVVSPLYFDTPSYAFVRRGVREALDSRPAALPGQVRFVVTDDSGGLDAETQALEKEPEVTVLRPPFNLGHQRALVFALRSIVPQVDPNDLVVTLDSDGEDRPEDVPRMLAPLLDGKAHQNTVVLALREQRRETLPFKVLYLAFRILFRVLTGTTIRSGNFAAFRGATARDIFSHPYFDLCYSSTLVALDLPVTYVPCPRGERFAGQSRMSYERLLMHGIRMLMPFTDHIAIRALIAFASTFAISVLAGVALLVVSLMTESSVSGWAVGGIIALMGISLLSLANAIVLFAIFSQSRGISLGNLEQTADGSPGSASSAPD